MTKLLSTGYLETSDASVCSEDDKVALIIRVLLRKTKTEMQRWWIRKHTEPPIESREA